MHFEGIDATTDALLRRLKVSIKDRSNRRFIKRVSVQWSHHSLESMSKAEVESHHDRLNRHHVGAMTSAEGPNGYVSVQNQSLYLFE